MARRATERGRASHGDSRKSLFGSYALETEGQRLHGSAGSCKMQVAVVVDKAGHDRRAHLDGSAQNSNSPPALSAPPNPERRQV